MGLFSRNKTDQVKPVEPNNDIALSKEINDNLNNGLTNLDSLVKIISGKINDNDNAGALRLMETFLTDLKAMSPYWFYSSCINERLNHFLQIGLEYKNSLTYKDLLM